MMILFNLLHIRFPIDLCIFCKPLAESHGERRVLSLQGIFQTIRAHKTASTATNAGASHFACFRSVARLTPSRTTFMIGQVTSQMPFTCTVSFEKISERDCSSLTMENRGSIGTDGILNRENGTSFLRELGRDAAFGQPLKPLQR